MFEQIKEYVKYNRGTLAIYAVTLGIGLAMTAASIITGHTAFASRGH